MTTRPTIETLKAAFAHIHEVATHQRSDPYMGIPPRPDVDADLLVSEALKELGELRKFKEYVHKRLDDAGVPKDPPGPHSEAGCRVGQRLDVLEEKLRVANERVEYTQNVADNEHKSVMRLTQANNELAAQLNGVYDAMGLGKLNPDDRTLEGVQGYVQVQQNAIRLQRERGDELTTELKEARAALGVLRGVPHALRMVKRAFAAEAEIEAWRRGERTGAVTTTREVLVEFGHRLVAKQLEGAGCAVEVSEGIAKTMSAPIEALAEEFTRG